MFKKTRRRLVLLNSIVLLLILSSFCTFLYFYMQYRLDRQVDETLQHVKTQIVREHYGEISEFINPEKMRRIIELFSFFGEKTKFFKENCLTIFFLKR